MGISSGKAGTVETLKIMRGLVRSYKKSVPLRMTALDIVQSLNQKDYAGELRALQQFVRDQIRYVRDIRGIETVSTPDQTLITRQGDCDDKSVLLATLLEAIGHPTRFVAVGYAPGEYAHVLVESRLGGGWIPAETTEPVDVGWYPPGMESRLVIHN